MQKYFLVKILSIVLIGLLTVTGCSPVFSSTEPAVTSTPIPKATLTKTLENTPTPLPTISATPTDPPSTATPTLTPTPNWVSHEPGRVVAPILLYHHVEGDTTLSRYQVSIPDFRAQMQTLDDMGFTAIPISTFLEVLLEGGELPEKPVVITFDDGHLSVYENAFPLMAEFDFPGVFYIVANRINGASDFVTTSQLKEMINAGWEVGSHSYSHLDLTKNHGLAAKEIGQSKTDLELALSTDVTTFAYPFGTIDPFTAQKVSDYAYRAGMGLGTSKIHTWNTLFYLNRIEVYGYYSLEDFKAIIAPE